jgi:alkanesulfonate monooxygenase SsuD/methylene tetrahydromethanopterin reductase-like flavin-dependent oxidoreductase (luciferase family)
MGADGKPAAAGLIPTLEESLDQRTWLVGTAEEVAAGIQDYRDELGVENITFFPSCPGDTYEFIDEQMTRLSEDVLPLLS